MKDIDNNRLIEKWLQRGHLKKEEVLSELHRNRHLKQTISRQRFRRVAATIHVG